MLNYWTKEDDKFLIDNYQILKYSNVAEKLGRTTKSIKHRIKKLNLIKYVDGTKYPINESFFDKWSNDMAYILGYIVADGSINSKKRTLCFNCKREDKCILEYIKSFLSPTRPLHFYKNSCKDVDYPVVKFDVTSQHLANSLSRYYVVPRKTGIEKLPEIPKEYVGHYLRGLFDGDGCISGGIRWNRLRNNNYLKHTCFIVSANKEFLSDIQYKYLNNFGHIYSHNGCYTWSTSHRKHTQYFCDLIYKDHNFALSRKLNKFLELGFSVN